MCYRTFCFVLIDCLRIGGSCWRVLEAKLEVLRHLGGILEALGGILEALGNILGDLGSILDGLGSILEASWAKKLDAAEGSAAGAGTLEEGFWTESGHLCV